jgi:hypothetical protein
VAKPEPSSLLSENIAPNLSERNVPQAPHPTSEESHGAKVTSHIEIVSSLDGQPSGTFWLQDGSEMREMETDRNTVRTTEKTQTDIPPIFYRRTLGGWKTTWQRVEILKGQEKNERRPSVDTSDSLHEEGEESGATTRESSVLEVEGPAFGTLTRGVRVDALVKVVTRNNKTREEETLSGIVHSVSTKYCKLWIRPQEKKGEGSDQVYANAVEIPSPGWTLLRVEKLSRKGEAKTDSVPSHQSSDSDLAPCIDSQKESTPPLTAMSDGELIAYFIENFDSQGRYSLEPQEYVGETRSESQE